ncbi:MAG: carbohydrate ABC transporter substrate-binding protein [Anaerolineae bacterium]|nr:carbohydrate ABC transporter substrate-binding protein [Anaerolineae bacterium]
MSKKLVTLLTLLLLIAVAVPNLAVAQDEEDLLFPIGEGPFTWSDLEPFQEMDLSGEEVVFFGPWQTDDLESVTNVVEYFNFATGANVIYIGSDSFEQQIVIDCESGDPPNLAAFPQPGLAANLAASGCLTPLGEEERQFVLDNYAAGQSWVDLATYANPNGEEQFYGLFYNVNLKSIVWYVPDNFADAGYEIPATWDELVALSEQIVADGGTPWCIGVGSGPATGWPATDWVEDIMLRTVEPEVYTQWTTNELPFTDERVQNAIEMFGMIARNDDFVAGGAVGAQTTDFRDSPAGLFTLPPECYMHRQASFIAAFFPEDVEVGVDTDFFYFPPIDPMMGNPVLGGGTVVTIAEDSEATREFYRFLQTSLAHELWMAQAGFLTPHTGANLDAYSSDVLRGQGEILVNADTFGFDGSDLMPGAIGAGAFWTGMVDYLGGASVEEVTEFVQSEWDAIK